tara:strand:+ start:7465 stop:8319 length:855 start_codon:yes stop_codon:yes gene_type:complete
MSIPYLPNYNIKPFSVSALGEVVFTDGTNEDLIPNEDQCKAYGYTYDKSSGMCKAFNFTTTLNSLTNKEKNNIQGTGNIIQEGTNNTYIMGEKNAVNGLSRNNIIIGSNNEISSGVNNANVFGTLGDATASNSIILGGNHGADILGERQNTTLMYGGQTTDASATDAYLNNTTDSYFEPQLESAFYYQAETLALRVGGTEVGGAVGDYASWVERGVVKYGRVAGISISRTLTAVVSSGTVTGWTPENQVSGSYFKLVLSGATGMIIEWVSTIRITEIRTSISFP